MTAFNSSLFNLKRTTKSISAFVIGSLLATLLCGYLMISVIIPDYNQDAQQAFEDKFSDESKLVKTTAAQMDSTYSQAGKFISVPAGIGSDENLVIDELSAQVNENGQNYLLKAPLVAKPFGEPSGKLLVKGAPDSVQVSCSGSTVCQSSAFQELKQELEKDSV